MVSTLLQADPSLATRSVSQTAIQVALEGDHACVVGALIDATARSWFRAELRMAVATGAIQSLALLLKRGFAANERMWWGLTPLMCAAKRGRLDMVEVLLAAGAEPAWRDTHGMTAADHAGMYGHRAVVRALDRQVDENEGTGNAA
jgi:ankyrin repeat protein